MCAQEPEDKATQPEPSEHVLDLARLARKTHRFELIPDSSALDAVKADLELLGLRKVRLKGQIEPAGKEDWHLTAHLGATVSQACIVTLAPVTTRIEETLDRRYVADWVTPDAGTETEMPQDDSLDPLPRSLDLMELAHEALSLALPLYPRAKSADFEGAQSAEPGVTPMRDEDVKPFAGLAALKAQMTDKDDPETT